MKNIVLILLLLVFPYFVISQNDKFTDEIVILHVNDIHGRIDQFPTLSAMIKNIKVNHKNVILVSAGDMFSGNPIVDRYSENGFPIIDLMNDLNFDLSTIGNHEFDFGTQVLAKRIKDAKFPFIVANMQPKIEDFPKSEPYKIYKFGKAKIAILGITQVLPIGIPDTRPENCQDFIFTQGIEKTKEYKWLSKKTNALIVLSHMGVYDDSLLATQMPEVLAIIGGHSHTLLLKPLIVNGVSIVQTGYYLKNLGVLTIKLNGKKIVSISDTLLLLKNYSEKDSLVAKKVAHYNNNNEFKEIVGFLGSPLNGLNELGGFMADAALKAAKTDFAFQNSGGIRVLGLPAGPITNKQIYELDPFANEIMICKMTATQIRELIAYGYIKEKKADMISSGLNSVIYLNNDKSIDKIELKLPNGDAIDENIVYATAINSYVVSSYKFSKTGSVVRTGITTTDAIFRLLSSGKEINCSGIESAKIIFK
ncbi:MAG: hypothetical protein COZ21_04560 [Bacteroidetes bacterium CG_4_10_14_3_um_filter_31_20]|nr:MAG: hypothetical protein COZ21_04560 [Bacteroidetes bacterium CG_4_10_14_3_um_filter_31_20]